MEKKQKVGRETKGAERKRDQLARGVRSVGHLKRELHRREERENIYDYFFEGEEEKEEGDREEEEDREEEGEREGEEEGRRFSYCFEEGEDGVEKEEEAGWERGEKGERGEGIEKEVGVEEEEKEGVGAGEEKEGAGAGDGGVVRRRRRNIQKPSYFKSSKAMKPMNRGNSVRRLLSQSGTGRHGLFFQFQRNKNDRFFFFGYFKNYFILFYYILFYFHFFSFLFFSFLFFSFLFFSFLFFFLADFFFQKNYPLSFFIM